MTLVIGLSIANIPNLMIKIKDMDKDLQINYKLIIEALTQSILTKQEQINDLKFEIEGLYNQIEVIENKQVQDSQNSTKSNKSERKYRWSALVIKSLLKSNFPINNSQIIENIINGDRGEDIKSDYKPHTYRHRINTAIRNHVSNGKIFELESNIGNDSLYTMSIWLKENILKKIQFQKLKLTGVDISEYGLESEAYIENDNVVPLKRAPNAFKQFKGKFKDEFDNIDAEDLL